MMRTLSVALIALLALSGCMTRSQRYARDFVQDDARSEAQDTAIARCKGEGIELIPGRKGWYDDDYRCVPAHK